MLVRSPATKIARQVAGGERQKIGAAPIRIEGRRVVGGLDLSHRCVTRPVIFRRCVFDTPIDLSNAHLRFLSFEECEAPGVSAVHIDVDGDLKLTRVCVTGLVKLDGARVKHELHLEHTTIQSTCGVNPASTSSAADAELLDIDGAVVQGDVIADALSVAGRMSIRAARISGGLTLTNSKIGVDEGSLALDASGTEVMGKIDANGLRCIGSVRIIDVSAQVLKLRCAQIRATGRAVDMDRLRVAGSLFFDEGAKVAGAITAIGIDVGGSAYFAGSNLCVPSSMSEPDAPPALRIERGHIKGDLVLCEKRGLRSDGGVSIDGLRVDGRLRMDDATLLGGGREGRAFSAQRTRIASHVNAAGLTISGVVDFSDAKIDGNLELTQAHSDQANSVVRARRAHVVGRFTLRTSGVVDTAGARVDATMILDTSRLRAGSDEEAAADLCWLTAGVLQIEGIRPRAGLLDLTRAQLGVLRDQVGQWPPGQAIVLDGLTYQDIRKSGVALQDRLRWLRDGTTRSRRGHGHYHPTGYTPQPYEQLASVLRATGNDDQARVVLLHKHRHYRSSLTWRWQFYRRIWSLIQDIAVGYGYVAWRAFTWIVLLIAIGTAWIAIRTQPNVDLLDALAYTMTFAVPGVGVETELSWNQLDTISKTLGLVLLVAGITIGATLVAGVARVVKRE